MSDEMPGNFRHPREITPSELAQIDQSVAQANSNLDTAVASVAQHLREHAEPIEGIACSVPCIGAVALWFDAVDKGTLQRVLTAAVRRLAEHEVARDG